MNPDLVNKINQALPQTQCKRCGYPNCLAYAEAIACEGAAINQCPPGGYEGVQRIAHITGQTARSLNPANGTEAPRLVVWIDETWCIGCTLCIKACPVDAIVGANKQMHTVIEDVCTGCELCLPVCPVDCMHTELAKSEPQPPPTGWDAWSPAQASESKKRYELRSIRLNTEERNSLLKLEKKASTKFAHLSAQSLHTDPMVLDPKKGGD